MLEERDRLAGLDRARTRFIPFVKRVWPEFIPGAHHNIMGEAFEQVASGELKRLIINMAPRHRLDITTEIPTTQGWKQVKDVRPGDYVFAPNGTPVCVTGASAVYDEMIYRVETSDGQVIECDGEHLWTVRFGSGRPFVIMTTKDILAKIEAESWGRLGNYPMLPPVQPVQYPYRELPIDPYVLGAWLGDGTSASGTMSAHPADAQHIRARFEAAGVPTTTTKWDMTFGTKGLRVKLRALGVLDNKHIPESYLTASIEQRRALLQGLMDTDGSVSAQGKCVFNGSNLRLMQGALELIHSFGVKARLTTREAKISFGRYMSKQSYRISFKMAGAASLPRKASRCRNTLGNFSRAITITKTDKVRPVQCLEVANTDGLFLAGRGYVVTHNTKSELTSWLLPAWFLGRFPKKKIIQASNTADLAAGFGRRVRNMIDGAEGERNANGLTPYQELFPELSLAPDSQAAALWHTNKGGEYFAIGVNGKVTGKGGDIVIIDDPHSEQEAKQAEADPGIYDTVYDWYTSGPRQRLQPGGAIIIVMTRWSKRDLAGRVIQKMGDKAADQWKVINLPAILDEGEVGEDGQSKERSMWPGFWPLEELRKTRASLPVSKWKAQYQQEPTSEQGAILKREYWRTWGDPDRPPPAPWLADAWKAGEPPPCTFVIQSWDCAATKTDRANYNACTTWGIFEIEIDGEDGKKRINNAIMLSAFRRRMEFPELKAIAKRFYDEDKPDSVLVEYKSAGIQLIQEFVKMGIPVARYSGSSRGRARGTGESNDKVARANAVADTFSSGYVWAPETRWAEEVIEECAEFPYGEYDDYVDSVVQAIKRFRDGSLIRTANDNVDNDRERSRFSRKRMY